MRKLRVGDIKYLVFREKVIKVELGFKSKQSDSRALTI